MVLLANFSSCSDRFLAFTTSNAAYVRVPRICMSCSHMFMKVATHTGGGLDLLRRTWDPNGVGYTPKSLHRELTNHGTNV